MSVMKTLLQTIASDDFSINCLSQALDWLNEGVLMIEARKDLVSNKIIYANKRLVEMVGFTSEELIGRGSHDFYDQNAFHELQEKVRHTDEFGRNQYEFFLPSKEGKKIPVVVLANPKVASPAEAIASGKPVLYIQGNIHSGEVEGKEVVQQLMRDILLGEKKHLLDNQIILTA